MMRNSRSAPWARSGVLATLAAAATWCPLYGQQDAVPAIPKPGPDERTPFPVTDVLDGDTIVVRVNGQSVRVELMGVSAPPAGRFYHDEARRFLENLLVGEAVHLTRDERATTQPESPGPRRAYVFRSPDDLFVNLELVRQGYAKVAARPPFEHQQLLRYYEHKARQARKGVWSPRSRQKPNAAPAPGGRSPATRPARPSGTVTVYVTRTGKKYHRQDCQHLRMSSVPLPLSDARQRGYTPCSRCKPPD